MPFTIFQNEKPPFQAIKTSSSKSRKIDIFSKGLTHGFGPNMAIFAIFFFQAILVRKMSFTILQNEKTPFQAIKTRSSKSRKIDIFSEGLTHGFVPNMAIFPIFFFQAILVRKMSFTIFQNENTPYQAIKTRSSKRRKITHGFGPNMASFPTFFFKPIQVRKMSFTIFLNEKTPFQAIKTTSSKSRKIDIFSKGLTHGFGPNMAIFPIFFLGNNGQENVFYDILERKKRLTRL